MNHLMIDLETLGTGVDSAFISIGAVFFDPETKEQGESFYRNVDWQSCIDEGRTIDVNTIKWWFKQSNEAREALLVEGQALPFVLNEFESFIKTNSKKPIVWGNGSSFDISIMEHAYRNYINKCPWDFWNVRDVRTIKDLSQGKYIIPNFIGTKHNALADAKHQAEYVSEMWKILRK